jgi:hypothetical protein
MQFSLLSLAALASSAIASAVSARGMSGIDFEGIQNKVRSGAIAIANNDHTIDEHNKKASYRNGDLIDTTIAEAPAHKLLRRQGTTMDVDTSMSVGTDKGLAGCGGDEGAGRWNCWCGY